MTQRSGQARSVDCLKLQKKPNYYQGLKLSILLDSILFYYLKNIILKNTYKNLPSKQQFTPIIIILLSNYSCIFVYMCVFVFFLFLYRKLFYFS